MVSVPSLSWSEQTTPTPRKGNIKQSVSRWCYKDIPLDKLCAYSAQIGCKGIDLLGPEDYEVPRRYGLICSMAYGGGGDIPNALNRVENHAKIEGALRKNIPLAAKAGIPNLITFSGNRAGMSDEEGAKNTIIGLNRIKKIAEDKGRAGTPDFAAVFWYPPRDGDYKITISTSRPEVFYVAIR